jgi:hypothetical protein
MTDIYDDDDDDDDYRMSSIIVFASSESFGSLMQPRSRSPRTAEFLMYSYDRTKCRHLRTRNLEAVARQVTITLYVHSLQRSLYFTSEC